MRLLVSRAPAVDVADVLEAEAEREYPDDLIKSEGPD